MKTIYLFALSLCLLFLVSCSDKPSTPSTAPSPTGTWNDGNEPLLNRVPVPNYADTWSTDTGSAGTWGINPGIPTSTWWSMQESTGWSMPENSPNTDSRSTETRIAIKGFAFSPATITVKKGTYVVWRNEDSVRHTVTFKDFGSNLIWNGETYTYRFNQTGTFPYYCIPHPYMKGSVTVVD